MALSCSCLSFGNRVCNEGHAEDPSDATDDVKFNHDNGPISATGTTLTGSVGLSLESKPLPRPKAVVKRFQSQVSIAAVVEEHEAEDYEARRAAYNSQRVTVGSSEDSLDEDAGRDWGSTEDTGALRHRRNVMTEEETALWLEVLNGLEAQDEVESNNKGDNDDLSEVGDSDSDCSSGSDRSDYEAEPLGKDAIRGAWGELKKRVLPSHEIAAKVIRDVTRIYMQEKTVVFKKRPTGCKLIVVGDIHGHFGDLMHIFETHGEPNAAKGGSMYLFNGDFVDRGNWGPEVMLSIYCWKLIAPEAVWLNRGNHEDKGMNTCPTNGFRDHCDRAWPTLGEKLYNLCFSSFKALPLVHVIDGEIMVCHGGLPLDDQVTLQEIAAIPRQQKVPTKHCNVLGYRKNQTIWAKRELTTNNGIKIPVGTKGNLLHKAPETGQVVARFQLAPEKVPDSRVSHAVKRQEELCNVFVSGAPHLEKDIKLASDGVDTKEQREYRIFVALLWSDPGPKSAPSCRGAGCIFDMKLAESFLKKNNLKCILRSHQKKDQGYDVDHKAADGRTLVATVFSASNYPAGAGEPEGNKAAVAVIDLRQKDLSPYEALTVGRAWRECYTSNSHWTGLLLRDSTYAMLKVLGTLTGQGEKDAEKSSLLSAGENAQDRALNQLWLLIYSKRGLLLAYFNRIDTKATGLVVFEDWCKAMRMCVIYIENFPWDKLAPWLCDLDDNQFCRYAVFLARYENALSARLAETWYGRAMMPLTNDIIRDAEEAWNRLDADQSGELSFQELRPFFTQRDSSLTAEVEDERVFCIMSSLDTDCSGFVDKDEFMAAISKDDGTGDQQQPMYDPVLADQCWTAIQGVLAVLCACKTRVSNIFHLFDEDGNSSISREEFSRGLRRLLAGTPLIENVEGWEPLMWKLIDEDSSESISILQLGAALTVIDKGDPRLTQKRGQKRSKNSNACNL